MKRSRSAALLILLALCCCTPLLFALSAASADMGPKPAVSVTFSNLGSERICVTLLGANEYSGPHMAFVPDSDNPQKTAEWITSDGRYHYYYEEQPDEDYTPQVAAVWQAFADYAQQDDYYFLQIWWELQQGQAQQFDWSYYAPRHFKLLVYYPDSGRFLCSDAQDAYAYHSYYSVDMQQAAEMGAIALGNTYDYLGEVLSVLFRIVATALVELLVALVFRLNSVRQLLTVLFTNVVTQTALNVALNLVAYFNGFNVLLLILLIIPAELAVFVAEAVTYSLVFRKEAVPVWKSVLYALIANVLSFVLGLALLSVFPFLF